VCVGEGMRYVRASARACVCVCVCGCTGAGAGVACAHVALLVPYATCWRRILCGFSGSTTFFDILINDTIFEKKKLWNVRCVF
jgi:hypothetical protein